MAIEFELWMKDRMSPALKETQKNSRAAFGSIDKDIQNTDKLMQAFEKPHKFTIDVSDIRNAGREVDGLMGKMAGFGRSMMGGIFMGGLATQGVMMAGRRVMDAGKGAFDNGVELENMKVGLQTFVGNRANEIVEGVLKQAFYTPFTTASLLPIEMGFIATGMTPERSNKDMMNLANAVAATGGNDFVLNRIGSDMMGAAAKGSIQGRELMELQRTAHINIQALVAKDLFPNMPMEQSLKRVEDMDISFKEFESAINRASEKGGMFAGALERLSQTVGGKNSTIKDMWWNVTAKLMEAQSGPIKRIQDGIINGLSDIPGILAKATPVFDKLFDEFDELWPSMKAFGSGLWDLLKPIGGIFISKEFTNLAQQVLDVATDLEHVLKPAIAEASKLLKGAFGGIGDWIKELRGKGGEHKTNWKFGDPFFESATAAKERELFGWNSMQGKIAAFNEPLFGTRKGQQKRAMWSIMPDLGFTVGRGKGDAGYMTKGGYDIDVFGNKTKKSTTATPEIANSVNDAVLNGGQKHIVINVRFGEHMQNTFHNVKEGVNDITAMFEENLIKVLAGVPGMQ